MLNVTTYLAGLQEPLRQLSEKLCPQKLSQGIFLLRYRCKVILCASRYKVLHHKVSNDITTA